ncbi:cupin domain-containing protein [Hyphomonas sp. WL0036]|uniref:cupin domain-containing protein n=1 Tax=Hyphomonas sediminis TaxID=2866160 RepID=UPI001C8026AE|nr:cupin domain-containing protein [Hyphomonas sediminis]MBY9067783.1 cupin domain-containing protein [Hyphomonas sediminis]
MPKIDISTVPEGKGTRYPAPYGEPCRDRHWRALGNAAGLTQFGVNLLTLDPGVWSSQRHWHTHEDEFVWVLEGEVVMVTDEGRELMRAGDCAGFPAGSRNGHHFINESDAPAKLLIAGSRDDKDACGYSDIDMHLHPSRYSDASPNYTRKDGTPF